MDEREEQYLKIGEAYRRLFDTPDGKAVLKDLSNYCFESESVYDDKHERIYFKEGRRSVILKIRQWLATDPKSELQREG